MRLTILILAAGILAPAADVAPPAPKIAFPTTAREVVEAKAGDVVTRTYRVKNEGNADLVIQDVAPG
jgi:hypothetical protein